MAMPVRRSGGDHAPRYPLSDLSIHWPGKRPEGALSRVKSWQGEGHQTQTPDDSHAQNKPTIFPQLGRSEGFQIRASSPIPNFNPNNEELKTFRRRWELVKTKRP